MKTTVQLYEPAMPDQAELDALLEQYARIKTRVSELAAQGAEMAEAILADNSEYQSVRGAEQLGRESLASIEARLAPLFPDREEAVSAETTSGSVRVTWGKARETWTLAHPASWYATGEAEDQLRHTVLSVVKGISQETAHSLVFQFFKWLRPTVKVGELPAPTITVRDLAPRGR